MTGCRIFVTHEYKKKNRGYTRNILLVSVYTPCAKLSTICDNLTNFFDILFPSHVLKMFDMKFLIVGLPYAMKCLPWTINKHNDQIHRTTEYAVVQSEHL